MRMRYKLLQLTPARARETEKIGAGTRTTPRRWGTRRKQTERYKRVRSARGQFDEVVIGGIATFLVPEGRSLGKVKRIERSTALRLAWLC